MLGAFGSSPAARRHLRQPISSPRALPPIRNPGLVLLPPPARCAPAAHLPPWPLGSPPCSSPSPMPPPTPLPPPPPSLAPRASPPGATPRTRVRRALQATGAAVGPLFHPRAQPAPPTPTTAAPRLRTARHVAAAITSPPRRPRSATSAQRATAAPTRPTNRSAARQAATRWGIRRGAFRVQPGESYRCAKFALERPHPARPRTQPSTACCRGRGLGWQGRCS